MNKNMLELSQKKFQQEDKEAQQNLARKMDDFVRDKEHDLALVINQIQEKESILK